MDFMFQTLVGWGIGNALTAKLQPMGFIVLAFFVLVAGAILFVVSPKFYRMVK